MKTKTQSNQDLDGALLGKLLAQALKGDTYQPTLAHPTQLALADAYDAACAELGLSHRSWRGSRKAA
jgi:hypothetical protein